MGIISDVGRKSWKVRLLVATIYTCLLAGAVTMVYPFMLMIAGSTKSAVDSPDPHIIPPYLVDRTALYRKYAEALFNESLDMMRVAYDSAATGFAELKEPASVNPKMVEAWTAFCRQADLSEHSYMIGNISAPRSRGVMPYQQRLFRDQMIERFGNDIEGMNRKLGTEYISWSSFYIQPEEYLLRRNKPGADDLSVEFRKFKATQPFATRYYFSPEGYYKALVLRSRYGKEIKAYNKAHGTQHGSWDEVHLDQQFPTGPGRTRAEQKDWEEFVRELLNLLWIRADEGAAPVYRAFLEAKYRSIGALNALYETQYASFDAVPLVKEPPLEGLVVADWDSFLQGWKDPGTGKEHKLPTEFLRVHSVDFLFRDHLKAEHKTLAALNKAMGTKFAEWREISPPQQGVHFLDFLQRTGSIKTEFSVRNFIAVLDYVFLHGRAIINTVIYCSLAILCALIVNPMAAYALSRYKPPSTYKVLLFLMLTMAFPPMVTQIPVFLMLREFHMLNTFFALILPGLANGYSIFLLKGFFDSLPRELYESASLDGASEWTMFWQLTMSLSKPILAVIALGAFTHAYSNFMMALLICQDEKMWTLMPWLYQLQQRSAEGVIFASLLIAALPTLIIFALCQNVIMRGIVVPVEK